jgi:hypothetical protein
MDIITKTNPLTYVGEKEYEAYWQMLFSTVLSGFWARALAVLFLVLAFWFGVRRQQVVVGFWFLVLALVMAYGGSLFRVIGLL